MTKTGAVRADRCRRERARRRLSSRSARPIPILGLALGLALEAGGAPAQERAACAGDAAPVARVVGVFGTVQVTPVAGTGVLLDLGSAICPGDRIVTGEAASVELRFGGADMTTGASSNTTLVIPADTEDASKITVLDGMLRFLTSVRRSFEFETPVVNAGIDGTEALIVVDGPAADSLVLMREGRMTLVDRVAPGTRLSIGAGDAGYASRDRRLAPATPETVPDKFRSILIDPAGAADWAVYYPPVLLAAALPAGPVRDAARALAAGRPEEAEDRLAGADLPAGQAAAALSILAIAAVFRYDREAGLALSAEAIGTGPALSAPRIARSYALQATGALGPARDAAEAATRAAPEDAYAWARLAELELTLGAYRRAERAVERALALRETSLARSIEGYLALARLRIDAAVTAFARALEIDSGDPLPRLGLGLAQLRRGNVAAGRAEIETAVALDPRRARLRTWLGRAYLEENLPGKGAAQLALAREEDPDDPTAYLFGALERHAANDPVGALGLIQRAEALGEARGTLRGRPGLAEDRAVRGAALARVYETLGFEQLARVTGAAAAERDAGNPEAHFFLSDAFRGRQGFEVAQTSSLLLGQILSPPNRELIQPRLAEADLGLLSGSGATRTTFAEFSPLVRGDGLSFGLSGRAGTQSTLGIESSAAVLAGPVSLAVGQFHDQTDGFTFNNDVRHDVLSIEGRAQLTPDLTLFTELRRRLSDRGDRRIEFGEEVSPFERNQFERNSARAALHYEPAPGHDLIALATFADIEEEDFVCDAFPDIVFETEVEAEEDGYDVQARYLGAFGPMRFTAGGALSRTDFNDQITFRDTLNLGDPCTPGAPVTFEDSFPEGGKADYKGGFAYSTLEIVDGVEATLGISLEEFERPGLSVSEANPKVGLRIEPIDGLSLRGAYLETLKRPLILDQTVEPATVAGFSQFYDDVNGATARLAGLGVDVQAAPGLWFGVEGTRRWIDTPFDDGFGGTEIEETRESTISAYANATLGRNWALSAEVRHERFDLLSRATDLPEEVNTTSVPLRLSWFGPHGLFASGSVAYVRQSVTEFAGAARRDDDGVLLGASVGVRLPNRRGIVALEARNLLDDELAFRDQSFSTPRPRGLQFARDRAVFLTATFALGRSGF